MNTQQSGQWSTTDKELAAKKLPRGWSLMAKRRPCLGSEHIRCMVEFCPYPLLCPSTSWSPFQALQKSHSSRKPSLTIPAHIHLSLYLTIRTPKATAH